MVLFNKKYQVYVGAYAEAENKSIYYYELADESGSWQTKGHLEGEDHCSFQVIDKHKNILYTTCNLSNGEGGVASYRIDPQTKQLLPIAAQAVGGAGPCYVSLIEHGTYLLTANYRGGNVSVLPVEDGRIGPVSDVVAHQGSGPNKQRQDGPHPHSIQQGYKSKYIFACDLGTDTIVVYQFDAAHGKLKLHREIKTAAGAGPRHMAFHPHAPYVYVINELNNTVTGYDYDAANGNMTEIQTISTLPQDFTEENTAADLHFSPCGKYLYGSNRGHDSIVVYEVSPETGQLKWIQHVSTEGKGPRNFAISEDGERLVAANQGSGSLASYRRDTKTGKLEVLQVTDGLLQPVCVTLYE